MISWVRTCPRSILLDQGGFTSTQSYAVFRASGHNSEGRISRELRLLEHYVLDASVKGRGAERLTWNDEFERPRTRAVPGRARIRRIPTGCRKVAGVDCQRTVHAFGLVAVICS